MAPFNWFNRQHNEQSTEIESAESTEAKESAPASAEPEAAESEQPPEVSQDYLNWAKAAYENIRKRQQESETQPETTETAPEAVVETTEIAPVEPSEERPEAELEAIEVQTSSEVTRAPETPEPASGTTDAIEASSPTVEASDALTPAVEEATTPETAIPLPFWAQAESERQERLERLRAEADEQEAEAQAAAVTASSEASSTVSEPAAIPNFLLDEGFLWSAEVLAAQGRRAEDVSIEEITWLKRLRQGLDKTRRSLVNQLRAIVGQGPLNQDAVAEIESLLLQADVGIEATDYIIESLQNKLRQETLPPSEAIAYLKQLLREMLDKPLGESYSAAFAPEKEKLNIWLITGVNGAGKTTTIGKLAHIAQKSGYSSLIAAADTFRAAAVQQVKVWGDRSSVEVIANPGKNTDPAAVVFDAITAAQSRQTELLLVDTAGRLQNKKNLMDELSKIRRIIDKKAPDAHIESLLVLDATLGQNGVRQAEVFSKAANLSGVVLTKLDGTAKGGIALAVVQQLGLPIRFIGAGEGIEDLRPFSSYEFVEALLSG